MLLYFRRYPLYIFIALQIILFFFYYTTRNSTCFFSSPKADYEWVASQVSDLFALLPEICHFCHLANFFNYNNNNRNTFSARMDDHSIHMIAICPSFSSVACPAVVSLPPKFSNWTACNLSISICFRNNTVASPSRCTSPNSMWWRDPGGSTSSQLPTILDEGTFWVETAGRSWHHGWSARLCNWVLHFGNYSAPWKACTASL